MKPPTLFGIAARVCSRLGGLLLVALLGACMTTYRLPAGAQSARLKPATETVPWICVGGKAYALRKGRDGYAVIPAGERTIIGANFYVQGYNVSYRCAPSISFVPQPGASYLQDFETEADACTALVFRETDDPRTGLGLEPSLDLGSCAR